MSTDPSGLGLSLWVLPLELPTAHFHLDVRSWLLCEPVSTAQTEDTAEADRGHLPSSSFSTPWVVQPLLSMQSLLTLNHLSQAKQMILKGSFSYTIQWLKIHTHTHAHTHKTPVLIALFYARISSFSLALQMWNLGLFSFLLSPTNLVFFERSLAWMWLSMPKAPPQSWAWTQWVATRGFERVLLSWKCSHCPL